MAIFRRRQSSSTVTAENYDGDTKAPIKRTFIPRLLLSLMYLVAFIFLILVEIGNLKNKPVIRSTYFLNINLANIVPISVPNAVLINSIAQSIGLHDFYQVGLWDFCEGYNGQGITSCSKPKALYWFNPVEIILNELLAGASIALPSSVDDALKLVRIASHWMFGFFLTSTVLTFLLIFIAPLIISHHQRYIHRGRRIFLRSLPLSIITFLNALFTIIASVIATAMFIIFRNVLTSQSDLNIEATLGVRMFAFMWIASGLNLIGFLWSLGNCCAVCCCSGKRKAKKEGILDEKGNLVKRSTATSPVEASPQSTSGNEKVVPRKRMLPVFKSCRVQHV